MPGNDLLENLFESVAKVKALKLFLRNPNASFSLSEGARRAHLARSAFMREVKQFLAIGMVKEHTIRHETKRGRRRTVRRERVYQANRNFALHHELLGLVTKTSPAAIEEKFHAMVRSLGRVKLAVIGGTLVNDEKGRLDVLLVGDRLHPRSIAAFVRKLEANAGNELRYMVLTPEEFTYRYGMFDNFLRDILDRPHKKLINKMKNVVEE